MNKQLYDTLFGDDYLLTEIDDLTDTEDNCVYVAAAVYRVLKGLGFDVQLDTALGQRSEYYDDECEEVDVLVHAVVGIKDYESPRQKWQIDGTEGFSISKDSYCLDTWEASHKGSTYLAVYNGEYGNVSTWQETFEYEVDFWFECKDRGSPRNEYIVEEYVDCIVNGLLTAVREKSEELKKTLLECMDEAGNLAEEIVYTLEEVKKYHMLEALLLLQQQQT